MAIERRLKNIDFLYPNTRIDLIFLKIKTPNHIQVNKSQQQIINKSPPTNLFVYVGAGVMTKFFK